MQCNKEDSVDRILKDIFYSFFYAQFSTMNIPDNTLSLGANTNRNSYFVFMIKVSVLIIVLTNIFTLLSIAQATKKDTLKQITVVGIFDEKKYCRKF